MIPFFLRRVAHAVILLFVTLTATFFVIHLAPGDPLDRYFSPDVDPRVMDTVRGQLGLDAPLPVQYVKTVTSFLRGDFGVSITRHQPVSTILGETIPRTLQLTGLALLLQIALGLGLGMLAAAQRNSVLDRTFSVGFLVAYSIPSFYLAFALIALFSLKLGWLPASGMGPIGDTDVSAGERLRYLILPVSVLALGSAAALARYARGSLLDVIHQEFVRTARAKGLAERHVLWRHVFKNALPQILTVMGLSVPLLLAGSVVVEKIFAWPGMGSLIVDSIFARDYPGVIATNFIAACMVILGNFLADVSHVWVDPRVRLEQPADEDGDAQ